MDSKHGEPLGKVLLVPPFVFVIVVVTVIEVLANESARLPILADVIGD